MSRAQRFLRAMIHCIVVEEQEKHVWAWLSIEHTPEYMQSWDRFEMRTWRGEVLRWLVESSIYWAPGGPDLQQGLSLWVAAIERVGSVDVPEVPKGPARAWLFKKICSSDTSSIPRGLFEKFMAIAFHRQTQESPFEKARVSLVYPGQPNADLGLDILRASRDRESRPHYMKKLVETDDIPKLTCFYFFVLDVARVLRDQGRIAEAREALDVGRDLVPSYFRGVIPKVGWRTRARQANKRQGDTDRWLTLGLNIAEDGTFKESELRRRQAEAAYKIEVEERLRLTEIRRQQNMKMKEERQMKSSRR